MAECAITVAGNLTRDPELRFSDAGKAFTKFGVAVNYRRKVNGEWEDDTSFFDVACFGELAEHVAESVGKGSRVLIFGTLKQRSYEKDGQKRSAVEIVADEVGPSLRWATAQPVRAEKRESKPAKAAASGADTDPF